MDRRRHAGINRGELWKDDQPTQFNWEDRFKFTSAHAHAHSITVEAPQSEDENFDRFKPGELLLTALADCARIDVANILTRRRQQVTVLEIKVKGTQLPNPPWAWLETELEYIIRGKNLQEKQIER